MALKTVKYTTTTELECACSFPIEVALCIPIAKVAPHLCADDTDQTWEYHHIDATLTDVLKPCNSCYYTYTFSYDEELLVDGELLYAVDILGVVCKDCEITYLTDLIGAEIGFISEDDGSITITTQHGCTFNFFPGESSLSILDTNSVNLTLTAGVSKVLSADVKISADVGNEISIHADGLFADFSQTFTPSLDATTDLGTLLLRFKNLYLSDSPRFANNTYAQWRNGVNSAWLNAVKVDAVDDLILNASLGNEIRFEINELEVWGISSAGELEQNVTNGGDIVFSKTQSVIRTNSTNGADTFSIELWSGSAESAGRGGKFQAYGNEHGVRPGWAVLNAGQAVNATALISADGVTSGRVQIGAGATGNIGLYIGGNTAWYVDSTGDWLNDSAAGRNLKFTTGSTAVVNVTTVGLAAAGATQGTATPLLNIIHVIATSAAGADGVVLPVPVTGKTYFVYNDDAADNVLVYPPVGGEINRLGANNPFTLTPGQGAQFVAHTTLRFFTTPV